MHNYDFQWDKYVLKEKEKSVQFSSEVVSLKIKLALITFAKGCYIHKNGIHHNLREKSFIWKLNSIYKIIVSVYLNVFKTMAKNVFWISIDSFILVIVLSVLIIFTSRF